MKEGGFPEKFNYHGEEFFISPISYKVEGKDEPYRMIVGVDRDEYGKTTKAMRPESEIRQVVKDNRKAKRREFNQGIKSGEIVAQKALFPGQPCRISPNPERYPPVVEPVVREPQIIKSNGVQSAFHPFTSWRPNGRS